MSQPEQPTFFMDENLLGKHLVHALRETGARVEVLSDHFDLQTPDVDWLAQVSQWGWLVLTRDQHIGINIAEQVAVATNQARMFNLTMGNSPRAEIEHAITLAIPKMALFVRSHRAPFIARISANGKVSKWLDYNRLLKTLRQYGPEHLG